MFKKGDREAIWFRDSICIKPIYTYVFLWSSIRTKWFNLCSAVKSLLWGLNCLKGVYMWELTTFVAIDWTSWCNFIETDVIDLFRGFIDDTGVTMINTAFVVVKLVAPVLAKHYCPN